MAFNFCISSKVIKYSESRLKGGIFDLSLQGGIMVNNSSLDFVEGANGAEITEKYVPENDGNGGVIPCRYCKGENCISRRFVKNYINAVQIEYYCAAKNLFYSLGENTSCVTVSCDLPLAFRVEQRFIPL